MGDEVRPLSALATEERSADENATSPDAKWLSRRVLDAVLRMLCADGDRNAGAVRDCGWYSSAIMPGISLCMLSELVTEGRRLVAVKDGVLLDARDVLWCSCGVVQLGINTVCDTSFA